MKQLITSIFLAAGLAVAFGANATLYEATDAIGEAPYRTDNPQHHHALWLKGLGTAPTKSWIFDGGPGSWEFTNMGTNVEFSGDVANKGDSSLTGSFDFLFDLSMSGNPKKELKDGSYTTDAGPTSPTRPRDIDTSTWTYWDTASGSFSGTGQLSGLELIFTQRPDPNNNPNDWKGQFGEGANGKNGRQGFASWLFWSVVGCVDANGNDGCAPLGLTTASNNVGDININLSPVPVPAAVWLFGSAMLALFGLRRRSRIG